MLIEFIACSCLKIYIFVIHACMLTQKDHPVIMYCEVRTTYNHTGSFTLIIMQTGSARAHEWQLRTASISPVFLAVKTHLYTLQLPYFYIIHHIKS